jgi:hypothetical protein
LWPNIHQEHLDQELIIQIKLNKKEKKDNFTSERELGFVNEAAYRGLQTPSSYSTNYKLVSPRIKSPDFSRMSKERNTKFVKNNGLTSCSYNPLTSFK